MLEQQQMGQMSDNEQRVEESRQGVMEENTAEQIKYLLSPIDVLQQIDNFLRGRYYDYNTNTWFNADPKMNDRGIAEVMRVLELRVSRVFSLSNFSDKEISGIMKFFSRELIMLLYLRREDFAIDKKDIPHVLHEICDCVYATLKQAQGDNMKGFLREKIKVVEHLSRGDRSIFSRQKTGLLR